MKNIYFETYSEAIQQAIEETEKKGNVLNTDDIFSKITAGGGKPRENETRRHRIKIDNKKNKFLNIQVYNRGNEIIRNFELNYYIG